jgi:valyl-tRNA synthetase
MLMNAAWPDGAGLVVDEPAEAEMAVIQALVGAVRSVRAVTMVGERKPLRAVIAAPRAFERGVLAEHGESARSLAFLEGFELVEAAQRPPHSAVAVAAGLEVFVRLDAETDLDKLKGVLQQRSTKLAQALVQLEAKLANPSFVERADPDVVAAERARRNELEHEREMLARNLAGL